MNNIADVVYLSAISICKSKKPDLSPDLLLHGTLLSAVTVKA